jgi:phage terminase large subunit
MPDKMKAFLKPVRYKFAYGGRGGGKSLSALKILLKLGNDKKIRVLCAREIQKSIKDSVHSLLKDIIVESNYIDYEVTNTSIKNTRTESEFIFIGLFQQETRQTIKSYANIDYCLVEEAQTISKGSLRILDPTIRKENSEIWFLFNRLLPDDPVWDFKERIPTDKKVDIKINYYDNPYLPDVLQQQAERSKQEYESGLNKDYLHIWEGEPYNYSEKTVFNVEEIYNAVNRDISDEGAIEIGADIARFGKDLSVFFKRKGMKVVDYKSYPKLGIDENVDHIINFANQDKSILIKPDDSGLGSGCTDYLKRYGYNVDPINNGSAANDPDKYNNRISEMWFYLKSIINEISIPDIQELKQQLLTREWKIDKKGRRCIETKEEYKKRGFKSPDWADALLLCYAQPTKKANVNIRFLG